MCDDTMNFMKNISPSLSLLYQVFNPQAKKQAFKPLDLSCLKAAGQHKFRASYHGNSLFSDCG